MGHVDETRRRRVRQGPDGIFFDAAARLEGARQADCAICAAGVASSPSPCRPLLTEFSTFTARVLASESWAKAACSITRCAALRCLHLSVPAGPPDPRATVALFSRIFLFRFRRHDAQSSSS